MTQLQVNAKVFAKLAYAAGIVRCHCTPATLLRYWLASVLLASEPNAVLVAGETLHFWRQSCHWKDYIAGFAADENFD